MNSSASSGKPKVIWVAAAFLFGIFIVTWVVPRFPWSEWNCQHQAIDINTGRLKFTRHLFYIKVSERIEDSRLSTILRGKQVDRTVPLWRRVNTFSPGTRHSPHYSFHSAIFQIAQLATWWDAETVPRLVQQKMAAHVVALWKYEDSDYLSGTYLAQLPFGDVALRQKVIARLESIDMPLVETNGDKLTMTFFYPDGTRLARCEGYFDGTGNFVRHGIAEQWYPNGKIQLHNHYRAGVIDGRRFQWGRDGNLSSIEGFRLGELVEYESDHLERHPDHSLAQKISTANGK